jgi:hypothetical protein
MATPVPPANRQQALGIKAKVPGSLDAPENLWITKIRWS